MTRDRILAAMTVDIERAISYGETPRQIAERLLLIPELGRAADPAQSRLARMEAPGKSSGPAKILASAADYLDDGFHARLVADLREIVEGGVLEEKPDV